MTQQTPPERPVLGRLVAIAERLIAGVAVAALGVTAIHLVKQRTQIVSAAPVATLDVRRFSQTLTDADSVAVGEHSLTDTLPPVRILVFTDLHCPFCARLHRSILELDSLELGARVTLFVRHAPAGSLHPRAHAAAIAAVCAAQSNRLREVLDLAFSDERFPVADLRSLVGEVGIPDSTAFSRCVESEDVLTRLRDDRELARTLGVSGTPTSFIEGKLVRGAIGLDSLAAEVRAAMTRTER